MLPWAVFFPVWGPSFDGQQGLRLALSVFSLVLLLSLCWLIVFRALCDSLFSGHDINIEDIILSFLFCSIYAMEKAFEVYIILSDVDRLITRHLGWRLVGFQVIEIISITVFFLRFSYYELVRPQETEGPPAR